MSNQNEKWYDEIGKSAVHAVVGLAMFLCFAIPSVIVYGFVHFVEAHGVGGFTLFMLHIMETFFMLFDFYVTCRYIVRKLRKP
jgi:hypothetical protein